MLFRVDAKGKKADRVPGDTLASFDLKERDFQAILFDSLDRLLPDDELLLIMQSRAFQEELDLMAVSG